jgi:hypothetical protein
LVGVAVNVTLSPAQIEVVDAEIDTEAGRLGLTVIVAEPLNEPEHVGAVW